MASKYYILNSSSLAAHEDNLDKDVTWNISGSQCIIEVDSTYNVPTFFSVFGNANEVQDYIYNPIRIDEWYQPDESEL